MEEGYIRHGDSMVKEGELVSIDGTIGEVFVGAIASVLPEVKDDREMQALLSWADGARWLGMWANADNPEDAMTARDFGAEGIGLCRTEHMFFEPGRLSLVRDMIIGAHRSTQDPQSKVVE